jgi:hypothetical protein
MSSLHALSRAASEVAVERWVAASAVLSNTARDHREEDPGVRAATTGSYFRTSATRPKVPDVPTSMP